MPDIRRALRRDNKSKQNSGRVKSSTDEYYDKNKEKNKAQTYRKRREEKEDQLKDTV